ncbi:MAG: hypothetical protein IKV86_07160 [Clostridia bacterium]|nr:hypothetical protein [Clostridia bacterium]
MKKIISIVMILCIALSFAACGSDNSAVENSDSEKTAADYQEDKTEEKSKEFTKPEDAQVEVPSFDMDVAAVYASHGISGFADVTGCKQVDALDSGSSYAFVYKGNADNVIQYGDYLTNNDWSLYSDETVGGASVKIYVKDGATTMISYTANLDSIMVMFKK